MPQENPLRILACTVALRGWQNEFHSLCSSKCFFFFFNVISFSFLMLCFQLRKSSGKQSLCVYSRPLQQPHLLDIASLQLVLSSSWCWSYRVISPTQRLLRWETWEVCGCQSRACRDDSVRHLEYDHYHAGTLSLALLCVLILCCGYWTVAGFIVLKETVVLAFCCASG